MKKLFTTIFLFILLLGFGTVAFSQDLGSWLDAFLSRQVGTSPSNGYILITDGTDSEWKNATNTIRSLQNNNWEVSGGQLTTTTTIDVLVDELVVTNGINTHSASTSDTLYVGTNLTVGGNLQVDGSATTTNSLWIGSSGIVENLDLSGGDLYVADDVEIRGDLFVYGTSTMYGNFSRTEGREDILKIIGSINQGGGAGYTGILMDITENTTGGGAENLLDFGVNSNNIFTLDSNGNLQLAGDIGTHADEDLLFLGDGIFTVKGSASTTGDFSVGGSATTTGQFNVGNDSDYGKIYITPGFNFPILDGYSSVIGTKIFGTLNQHAIIEDTSLITENPTLTFSDGTGTDNASITYGTTTDVLAFQGASYYLFDNDLQIYGNATTSEYLSVGETPPTGANYSTGMLNVQNDLVVGGYGQFNNVTTTDNLSVGGFASTTGGLYTQGNLHVGGTASFDGLLSGSGWTTSNQNFWNTTTTWAGFDGQFNTVYNATTTLNGFTPANYLLSATAATTYLGLTDWYSTTTWSGNLTVSGFASSTALWTSGSAHIGTNLVVDGSATTTGQFNVGNDSDYLRSYLIPGLNIPVLDGYSSTIGTNLTGIYNIGAILEKQSLNTNPSITFKNYDFSNDANIVYGTTTDVLGFLNADYLFSGNTTFAGNATTSGYFSVGDDTYSDFNYGDGDLNVSGNIRQSTTTFSFFDGNVTGSIEGYSFETDSVPYAEGIEKGIITDVFGFRDFAYIWNTRPDENPLFVFGSYDSDSVMTMTYVTTSKGLIFTGVDNNLALADLGGMLFNSPITLLNSLDSDVELTFSTESGGVTMKYTSSSDIFSFENTSGYTFDANVTTTANFDATGFINTDDSYKIDDLSVVRSLSSGTGLELGVEAGDGGTLTNQALLGYQTGNGATADDLVGVGYQAGMGSNGNNNTYLSRGSGLNATGAFNTCSGRNSCNGAVITQSLGLGNSSLRDMTLGTGVTGLGFQTGRDAKAINSTFIGDSAGQNSSSTNVLAVGAEAFKNAIGSSVTAIGTMSGENNTGNFINLFGRNSGNGNTGDYVNVFGNSAGINNIYDSVFLVGAFATAPADHSAVIGSDNYNGYITDFYLGRGATSTSQTNVTLHGTGGGTGNINGSDLRVVGGDASGSGVDGDTILGHDGTNIIGRVGIATSTPGTWYDEILAVGGDTHIYGNATTSGQHIMGFGSKIGDNPSRYFSFEEFSLGALGTLPFINPEGSSGGIIEDGVAGIMAGLNIMENDDIDTSNPIIRFFARDVASTFNLADIEYATTSKALSFNGADDYTFNDGDFTVVNGDVTLSTADDRTNNVACYLANGTLGYCSDQPDGSGQCTCNSN